MWILLWSFCAFCITDKEHNIDAEIFKLVDLLHEKTEHKTFYELFQVSAEPSSKQVDKILRQKLKEFHPDKQKTQVKDSETLFILYSGVASILKNKEKLERYEWILHQAPAWYRSSFDYQRSVSGSLSILQIIVFVFFAIIIGRFLYLWILFAFDYFSKLKAEKRISLMPKKERDRLIKKHEKGINNLYTLANKQLQKPTIKGFFKIKSD